MFEKSPPILTPDRIEIIDKIESKKCVFDVLTKLLEKGRSGATKNEIFDSLIAREKLGSTCVGNGIAIPRAHMKISDPIAALLIIKKGLDIETVDKKSVKVFLAMLIPDSQREKYSKIIKKLNLVLADKEHLKILTETDNQEYLANYFESLLTNEIDPEITEES